MSDDDEKEKLELNWPLLLGFVCVGLIAIMFGVRSWLQGVEESQLQACRSNVAQIAKAAEMYARDHYGRFPKSMEQLTTIGYLPSVPTCPTAKEMTYTDFKAYLKPDRFEVSCCGGHHRKLFSGSGSSERFPHLELGPVTPRKKAPPPPPQGKEKKKPEPAKK